MPARGAIKWVDRPPVALSFARMTTVLFPHFIALRAASNYADYNNYKIGLGVLLEKPKFLRVLVFLRFALFVFFV